jgi:hypothetical protein
LLELPGYPVDSPRRGRAIKDLQYQEQIIRMRAFRRTGFQGVVHGK